MPPALGDLLHDRHVVIEVNPAWRENRHMSDEELDRHEARRIAAEDRADRAAQLARMTEPPDGVNEPRPGRYGEGAAVRLSQPWHVWRG